MSLIKSELEQFMIRTNHEIPGMCYAIIEKGKIKEMEALGLRNLEESLPMTTDTHVRIASISKLVFTLAFLKLVIQKKIDLDEDIRSYFKKEVRNPYFPDVKITCRMLLSHKAGFSDRDEYYCPKEMNLIDYLKNPSHHLKYEPGTHFEYCNLNYGILATILELVTEQNFNDYLKKHLFNKMGMTCSFDVSQIVGANLPLSGIYRREDSCASPFILQVDGPKYKRVENYVIGQNGTLYGPQGGLRIHIQDLTKIALLILQKGLYQNQRILEEEIFEMMEEEHFQGLTDQGDDNVGFFQSYGLSMQKFPLLDGRNDYYGHTGNAYGLHSFIGVDLENQNGILFFINGVSQDPDSLPKLKTKFNPYQEQIQAILLKSFH